ncbi:helix-turn-helix transcriptional regulator [Streptomyces sp. RLA2-12]|nr:helix-turn-helix transcriptional regulator [Streptomyces sp. RLA2-12]
MARGLAHFSPSELRAHRMNVYARPDAVSRTAEELAEAVGATKAQILAYENGHRVPDPPRVRALARALKVHPWHLMNSDERNTWTLADFRRASGLRAQDVVNDLGISPKNYRRFENEGIVPSRRPQFVDEVAKALRMPRRMVEAAIDRTPAVKRRQVRAYELVVALAERYVPRPGPWKGPAADDPNLIELAAAYGRPEQRLRRVLTYELGELRQSQVRAERERVIADFDTDRERQAGAQHAAARWYDVLEKTWTGYRSAWSDSTEALNPRTSGRSWSTSTTVTPQCVPTPAPGRSTACWERGPGCCCPLTSSSGTASTTSWSPACPLQASATFSPSPGCTRRCTPACAGPSARAPASPLRPAVPGARRRRSHSPTGPSAW